MKSEQEEKKKHTSDNIAMLDVRMSRRIWMKVGGWVVDRGGSGLAA